MTVVDADQSGTNCPAGTYTAGPVCYSTYLKCKRHSIREVCWQEHGDADDCEQQLQEAIHEYAPGDAAPPYQAVPDVVGLGGSAS